METRPEELTLAERYRFLIGAIVPRPIALVSTISTDGLPNLAPFSFFNGIGSNPMTVLFCPGNHPDGSEKDTLKNAKPETEGGVGEFVINLAVEKYAREVSGASEPLPRDESEFELTGLEMAPSVAVRPPRVAASPIAFECKTIQVIRTNPGVPAAGNVVMGEVVHLYAQDSLVNKRMQVDPEVLRAIGRMGGLGYTTTRDRFEMPRGQAALDIPHPFSGNDGR